MLRERVSQVQVRVRAGWGLLLAVALGACGLGVAGAAVLLWRPQAVSVGAVEEYGVPVEYQSFADSRLVSLKVQPGTAVSLRLGTSGRLTASSCRVGDSLSSGQVVARVAGKAMLAFATGVPLWRDLASGDKGADVSAVQEELVRLGVSTSTNGVMDWRTITAVRKLAGGTDSGWDAASTVLSVAQVVWLPAPQIGIGSCGLNVGDEASPGTPWATAPGRVASAVVETPANAGGGADSGPKSGGSGTSGGADAGSGSDGSDTKSDDASSKDKAGKAGGAGAAPAVGGVPGDRVLRVDSESFPLDASMRLVGDGVLDKVALLPSVRHGSSKAGEVQTVSARVELAHPVEVGAVPPVAVYGVKGTAGCVLIGSAPTKVTIAGSELGQTLVQFPAGVHPDSARVRPGGGPSC